MASRGDLETEVAIVGGGPVGLCLAVELGWRGVECVVLEQRPRGTPAFPTANHIGVRTMEHLRRLGLAAAVREAFRPDWAGHWIALTYLGGPEVARIEDALASRQERSDSPEHEVWAPKPCFDPVLERASESYGTVSLRHGVRLESIDDRKDPACCVCRLQSGAELRIRARFVVACDGASSTVRKALAIPMPGPPPIPVRVHSAFFRSRRLALLVPRGGVQYMILGTPSGPTPTPFGAGLMVAVDGRELWRLHGPGLDADDEAASRARLHELGIDDAEILAMSAWTPSQGVSASFRSRRVFLAGDAAHVVTPFGGLGVNTGMADAFDLGWKLEATLRGWGGPRLLEESYDFERRRAAVDLLRYQGVDFSSDVPVRFAPPFPLYDAPDETLWLRNSAGETARRVYGEGLMTSRGDEFVKPAVDLGYRYDGSPLVCDDGSEAPDRSDVRNYKQTAKPGGRAPHVRLDSGRSTLDLFGHGFVLLRTITERDASAFYRAAIERHVPFRIETVPEAAAMYEAAFTLVRPDGFVAWRGAEIPDDPGRIIDIARGAGR